MGLIVATYSKYSLDPTGVIVTSEEGMLWGFNDATYLKYSLDPTGVTAASEEEIIARWKLAAVA